MRRAQRCAPRLWLCAALLLWPVRADVIFRVPEVLVRHAAAAKPVGTGHRNVTEANDTFLYGEAVEVPYEEYFIEHEVSAADAKTAARQLHLDGTVPETRPGCGACTASDLQYCETRLIDDHCCCEHRFFPEPFPWIPHTCYIGPSKCRVLASNCARYTRLRDCCCYKKLAKRWKSILSKSSRLEVSASLLLLSMIFFGT